MGIFSSKQRKAKELANQIRQDIHHRIQQIYDELKRQIQLISIDKRLLIKTSTSCELSKLMDKGQVTSLEIVYVFIERIARVAVQYSYVIDEMFQAAITRAKQVDIARRKNPHKRCWRYGDDPDQTFPPFFGVPISVSETIIYKDRPSYIGYATRSKNPLPTQNSNIILLINHMGFIPFVRSSVSQGCKSFQTNNNILGYAKNPWNQKRSCGGSCGGQGGLVGSYCSPFGVGNDLIGDVKVACEFTGCFTLKPFSRYCNLGNAITDKYAMGLPFHSQFAPITHSVQDLIIWNQFLCMKSNYEIVPKRQRYSRLKILPFKQQLLQDKKILKIGYLTDFRKQVKCSPAHRRSVYEAINILQLSGHHTFEIQIKQAQRLNTIFFRMWYANKNLETYNSVTGQKPISQFQKFISYAKWPWCIRSIFSKIMSPFMPRITSELLSLKQFTIREYFFMNYEINLIQKDIYAYLQKFKIDAVVCPGYFIPAYQLGESSNFTYCSTYSTLWSLLNYPVGCLPISTVREDQQSYEDYHKDGVCKRAGKNMRDAKGLPVGIQVISYPRNEELVLNIMRQIESSVKFNSIYKSRAFSEQ